MSGHVNVNGVSYSGVILLGKGAAEWSSRGEGNARWDVCCVSMADVLRWNHRAPATDIWQAPKVGGGVKSQSRL